MIEKLLALAMAQAEDIRAAIADDPLEGPVQTLIKTLKLIAEALADAKKGDA